MKNLLQVRIVLLAMVLGLGACSSGPQPIAQNYPEPIFTAERVLPPAAIEAEEEDTLAVYDPWEGFNKRMYNFNYRFDQAIFLPVANGYKKVVPSFARTGILNFFKNLADINTMVNSILQLSPTKFFSSTGRVLVNSTVGILGLFDVATKWDIPRPQEDFGQTLGHWGVGRGPYLVLPLLGPSNLRDGAGLIPDFYVENIVPREFMGEPLLLATATVHGIDTRSNTSFRYYQSGSAFEYELIRWLYSTKRDLDILK